MAYGRDRLLYSGDPNKSNAQTIAIPTWTLATEELPHIPNQGLYPQKRYTHPIPIPQELSPKIYTHLSAGYRTHTKSALITNQQASPSTLPVKQCAIQQHKWQLIVEFTYYYLLHVEQSILTAQVFIYSHRRVVQHTQARAILTWALATVECLHISNQGLYQHERYTFQRAIPTQELSCIHLSASYRTHSNIFSYIHTVQLFSIHDQELYPHKSYTHLYLYVCVYMYVYVCVCVCVCRNWTFANVMSNDTWNLIHYTFWLILIY